MNRTADSPPNTRPASSRAAKRRLRMTSCGNYSCELFVGGVGGAANVEVTEVAQGGAIFVGHAAGKVWIVEVAVARVLWHVLENAEALLDGFLALRRHVSPRRQNVILDVIALLRGHLLPDAAAFAHILLLLRRQLAEALPILQHALAVFGAEALLLVAIAAE